MANLKQALLLALAFDSKPIARFAIDARDRDGFRSGDEPPSSEDVPNLPEDSFWREQNDADDRDAIDDALNPRHYVGELGIEPCRKRDQCHGANNGPPQRADPTEHCDDERLRRY